MAANPAPTPVQIDLAANDIRRDLLNHAFAGAFTPQAASVTLPHTEPTIRYHSRILERDGLFASSSQLTGRPGRPATLYAITQVGIDVLALFGPQAPLPQPFPPPPAEPEVRGGLAVLVVLDEEARSLLEVADPTSDIVADLMVRLAGEAQRIFPVGGV